MQILRNLVNSYHLKFQSNIQGDEKAVLRRISYLSAVHMDDQKGKK